MAMRRQTREEVPKVKLTREKLVEAAGIFKYIRPYRWSFFFGLVLLFLSTLLFWCFPISPG